jgi:hypothetical protein
MNIPLLTLYLFPMESLSPAARFGNSLIYSTQVFFRDRSQRGIWRLAIDFITVFACPVGESFPHKNSSLSEKSLKSAQFWLKMIVSPG